MLYVLKSSFLFPEGLLKTFMKVSYAPVTRTEPEFAGLIVVVV